MKKKTWVAAIAILAFWPLLAISDTAEELFQAAREGDVKRVESLLDSGVEVGSKTRYGATALHFASDKGHIEVVRLLLERGADPNVTDTFYQTTPMTWALNNGHIEVARLLLEKGSDNAAAVLRVGAGRGDADLVKAALESGKLSPSDIRAALARAKQGDKAEVLELLEKAAADLPEEKTAEVEQSVLDSYAGAYSSGEAGIKVEISSAPGGLTAKVAGQPPLTLRPTGEKVFKGVEVPLEIAFYGRGGMVEGFRLQQGNQTLNFRRGDASAEAEAAEPAEAEEADEAEEDTPEDAPGRGEPLNWPGFRGPRASGVGDGQGAPTEWSVENDRNILWKTPIPGIANSSPAVWGGRVFVTTAISSAGDKTFKTGLYGDVKSVDDVSEHTWKVYCLDKESGEILWERTAARARPEVKRHFKSSQANSSPATDGERLAVIFPSQGLYVYDLRGELEWKKDLGLMDSGWFYDRSYQWGFAASPVIHEDKVIVQVDTQDQSFIAAFRLSDGEEVWRTPRDEIPTWSTPTVAAAGGREQVVTNGTTIRSYDADTGELLWKLGPNSEIIVATPVVYDGLIYLTAGYPPVRPIYAVRADARGDITLPEGESSSEHVAWSYERGGTYMPTPIAYRGYFYTNANNGRLTCYDAKTGERVYRARIGNSRSFSASPVAADGKLYFSAEDGRVTVVKAGPKYKQLAVNDLGDTLMATPAISDGAIIFRTLNSVIAAGAKE